MRTTLSSKGQVVLPAELRQQDGISPGQQFSIERLEAGEYLLKKAMNNGRAGLADARNLVAHAHVEIVDVVTDKVAIWRTAHHKNMLNARVMGRSELDSWFQQIQADQKAILAALR